MSMRKTIRHAFCLKQIVGIFLVLGLYLLSPLAAAVSVVQGIAIKATAPAYNPASTYYESLLTLTNTSKKNAVKPPLALAISGLPAGVSVAEPSGVANKTQYLSIPLPSGLMAPKQSIGNIAIKFSNPKKKKFTFTIKAITGLPELTPKAPNRQPIANAGLDQTVTIAVKTQLDGSASTDIDGQPLSYHWTLSKRPADSVAVLENANQPRPFITIDKPGHYSAQLQVNDGQINRLVDTVELDTTNSQPVAVAGPAKTAKVRSILLLDGSHSFDWDNDNLAYEWALVLKPTDSKAKLNQPKSASPSFKIDKPGYYVARLLVNDGQKTSIPDTVTLSTLNSLPVANAGADQFNQPLNQPVTLNSGLSSDADAEKLTSLWFLLAKPTGSNAQLTDANSVNTQFTPDLVGDYVAQLIVNDGHYNSNPDTLLVSAVVPQSVNQPPKITSNPSLNAKVGKSYSYNVNATDGNNNDTLTYALSQLQPGMSIDANTGILTWIPSAGQTGTQTVTITVNDGNGGSDTQLFSINVIAADQTLVPSLLNQTRTAAESALQDAELSIGNLSFEHNAQTEGKVINQSPASGITAKTGSAVNLIISLGPDVGLPPNPVTVAPALDQTIATTLLASSEFLYTGSNPIQTGVAAGMIEAKRAAVIRGKVLDKDNKPVSGVTVSIKDHTEFGQTLTREDGQYDLAVNGGGVLTVNLTKDGFLPAQRTLADVPWQNYVNVDDAMLLAKDSTVATLDLSLPEAIKVAQGSTVTDADGSRQAALMIPQGITALAYNPDGTTHNLSQLNMRFTEYTVGDNGPKQMPGPLPPTSAYTYAVDISTDEAPVKLAGKDVLFNQPVPFYVDNFLDMPIGIQVPVAYYDREKAAWIPSDDGRVIKILSIANGLANLDTDGNGAADSGAALGVTDAERAKLAQMYPAGHSLWRAMLSHLSTYDLNYGSGPQAGADQPKNPPAKPDPKSPCESKKSGSIIGCESQTLSEEIGITGTPFYLRYDSDRITGRKAAYSLDIPLSAETIPSVLKRIELEITVAGRKFTHTYPAKVNLSHHFQWDGLDAYGRSLQGKQQAQIRIDYVYDGYYNLPPAVARSFGAASGQAITGNVPTRKEVKLSQLQKAAIGIAANTHIGLGAWSLNAHHRYDPTSKTLYMGDGSVRDAESSVINASVISTIAGTGVAGFSGDGGLATSAQLNRPSGIAVGSDGSIYVTDYYGTRIRKITPDGIIKTIAGNGFSGFSGDNGLAINAQISSPDGIAVTSNDTLYFVDVNNNRIRRVSKDGIITTVVGTGVEGFGGDNGLAVQAKLDFNGYWHGGGIAFLPDGGLLFSETGNARVRQVDADGIIKTIAGTGILGASGDGGTAIAAQFSAPAGVMVGVDGSIYITDTNAHRVRRISNAGIITNFAGTGKESFSGDGGLAINAGLDFIESSSWGGGFPIEKEGVLYIPDTGNHRIRVVGTNGIINTLAGTGVGGFSEDGTSALSAKLNAPTGLAFIADGSLIFTDALNNRIRKISPALPGIGITDIAIPSQDGSEVYRFDATGRHLETKDALTGIVLLSFSYDTSGLLSKITDAYNNVTNIERDNLGNPTAIVSAFGQRTRLTLDSNGYLSSVTNPADETYKATYSTDGLLTQFENPRHSVSVLGYDALGKLASDTNAENSTQTLERTELENGYQVTHTSGNGLKTVYSVQNVTGEEKRQTTLPDGTVSVTTSKSDGSVTTTAADGTVSTSVSSPDPHFGMLAPVVSSQQLTTANLTAKTTRLLTVVLNNPADPLSFKTLTDSTTVNGRTATSTYDALSKTITATSPAKRVSKIVLDAKGRISQTQVTGILASNANYDALGRLESISQGADAEQRKIDYSYNPQGYLASVLDPLGRKVQFQYDQAGRVTTQTMPDGRQVLYSYDANGNLATLTPPGQPAHVFNYTSIDQTSKYLPPVVSAGTNNTVYTYDKDKALVSMARPDGQSVSLNYDTAGRVSSLLVSPANQTLASYAYQASTGKLTAITTPDAKLAFTYSGALLTQSAWTGAVTGSVGYGYDNDFRITAINLNDANAVTYSYDADSLLTKAGNLTLTRSSQNGLLTASQLGNLADSYSYNAFGELSGYEAKYNAFSHLKLVYSRDKLGRITQKQETRGGVLNTFDYSYDDAGRLAEVKKNNAVQSSYSYDGNGNRLTRIAGGVTQTGTYDAQDRLLTYNGTSYSYTANGELLSKTVGASSFAYEYDVLGNLKKVVLPSGSQIDYLTDGQNRRIGKKVNGNLSQAFLWQGQLQPIAELDGSGNVVSRFVYATGVNVPDYMVKGGVTYRIIKDHLGSPRVVVDTATNTVAQEMEFDEFGRVTKDTSPGFQPFGFAGGLYDRDTGLVRFGARDYDASIGRWVSKDPIGFGGQESNLYLYSSGDPIGRSDAIGLSDDISDLLQNIVSTGAGLAGQHPITGKWYDFTKGKFYKPGYNGNKYRTASSVLYAKGVAKTFGHVGTFMNAYSLGQSIGKYYCDQSTENTVDLALSVAGMVPNPVGYSASMIQIGKGLGKVTGWDRALGATYVLIHTSFDWNSAVDILADSM